MEECVCLIFRKIIGHVSANLLDFSFHCERGNELDKVREKPNRARQEKEELAKIKEKKAPLYGLSSSERRKQYRKNRDKNSPGYQRRSEADMSKAQSLINMLVRAIK